MGADAGTGSGDSERSKKKVASELSELFKQLDTEFEQSETAHLLAQRQLAALDYMLTGEADYLEAVRELDERLHVPPPIFDTGSERNVLVIARKNFTGLAAALAERGFPNAPEMTLLDFHGVLDYLNSKSQREELDF